VAARGHALAGERRLVASLGKAPTTVTSDLASASHLAEKWLASWAGVLAALARDADTSWYDPRNRDT